ncbi:Calcineurin-like phosphoesterase superfamily domain protein [Novipirellula galeiformis]|uniref:Calcineurin-like phosphoesterase superfamily domain protein n=1 Tax=Novipirellula galeiformis TaxID=2528004 RepID=A0A5C6CFV2_9BACT|nr:metallophosphoesterase family protein [Novipirellula galeiformis]TWU21579.1 Calcineurin-like phosphoesterase superfamily domain protein [Novipirellula galeiformis]
MKYLCFSDLHCDTVAAEKLVAMAERVDVVIGAGDFARQHRGISDTLDILSKIEKPAVLVPGNGETAEELTAAAKGWNRATVLHGNGCSIKGIDFWGVGGGIPVTPFGDWSYDFDETQAAELLADCPHQGVLVVHSPPIDSVDHDSEGRIRGSQSIRSIVETRNPRLVVCGHIHSDWEKQVMIGNSLVLNAGPAGVIVEIQ